jgi:hypothetical protein
MSTALWQIITREFTHAEVEAERRPFDYDLALRCITIQLLREKEG